jgi:DNA-binding NarL/FixJ family response regulator
MTRPRQTKLRILIADDHPLFRFGVRTELEGIVRFVVVAEAGDGDEAFRAIHSLQPDIAILDFEMPKRSGLDIARALEESQSQTRVILLTMHSDKKIFYAALDAGVFGYVLKDDAIADIVKAVGDVAAGKHFISGALTELLIEKASGFSADSPIRRRLEPLTATERKILKRIAALESSDEIAAALFISKRTVENYKGRIAAKLELATAKHLLRFALQQKDSLDV